MYRVAESMGILGHSDADSKYFLGT
jgi:hypothetical protein